MARLPNEELPESVLHMPLGTRLGIKSDPKHSLSLNRKTNIGALIIRIVFWGPLYYIYII